MDDICALSAVTLVRPLRALAIVSVCRGKRFAARGQTAMGSADITRRKESASLPPTWFCSRPSVFVAAILDE